MGPDCIRLRVSSSKPLEKTVASFRFLPTEFPAASLRVQFQIGEKGVSLSRNSLSTTLSSASEDGRAEKSSFPQNKLRSAMSTKKKDSSPLGVRSSPGKRPSRDPSIIDEKSSYQDEKCAYSPSGMLDSAGWQHAVLGGKGEQESAFCTYVLSLLCGLSCVLHHNTSRRFQSRLSRRDRSEGR